jgi:hypothetical protein
MAPMSPTANPAGGELINPAPVEVVEVRCPVATPVAEFV